MKKARIVLYVITAVFALIVLAVPFTGLVLHPTAAFLLLVAASLSLAAASIMGAVTNKKNGKNYFGHSIIAAASILYPIYQLLCFVGLL